MPTLTGFLDEAPGIRSTGRLVLHIVIATGVIAVLATLGAGLWAFIQTPAPVRHLADLVPLAEAVKNEFLGTVLPAVGLHAVNVVSHLGMNL